MTRWLALALLVHIWQSTIVLACAGLVVVALRSNGAAVRFRVWLAASLKFLIPFSLVDRLAGILGFHPVSHVAAGAVAGMAREVWAGGVDVTLPGALAPFETFGGALLALWIAGAMLVAAWRFRQWRTIHSELRSATSWDAAPVAGTGVRVTANAIEPCVVGIRRPMLLMPAGIETRLSESQLLAIVEHELQHVRRRDNMWAFVHMCVETLFWFHPAVWWLERRLIDERERACDEEVLGSGVEAAAYAEAILLVCRHYIESTTLAAGSVGASNLGKRIERIVTNARPLALTPWRRMLVAAAAAAVAIVAPLTLGASRSASNAASTSARSVAAAVADPAPARATAPAPAATRAPGEQPRNAPHVAPPAPSSEPFSARSQAATTGAVSGRVTDFQFDQPLAGAIVELTGDDGGIETAKTADTGEFAFRDVRPGIYTVVFTLDGYVTFKREGLTVRAGTEAVVNPRLKDNPIRD